MHTSPQVTVQFEITISLEFHVSVPSVFTVLYWELEVAFMSRFVMVTFCECATNVCLLQSVSKAFTTFQRVL